MRARQGVIRGDGSVSFALWSTRCVVDWHRLIELEFRNGFPIGGVKLAGLELTRSSRKAQGELPIELAPALGDYVIMLRSHWSGGPPGAHPKQEKGPCANVVT